MQRAEPEGTSVARVSAAGIRPGQGHRVGACRCASSLRMGSPDAELPVANVRFRTLQFKGYWTTSQQRLALSGYKARGASRACR